METTTYESPFPSGLYEPNIQAEKRLNSPLTVAAARAFNRHDVEIRRIEEVIGVPVTGVPAGSMMDRIGTLEDTVNPSGIVHGHVSPFHTGLGDGIGITADPNGNVTIGGHTSDAILHFPKQYGNTLPFHNDVADENYKYIQWFLQWMGMWDALSVGGTITPSLTEVVKALWQNKWDLEIMFEPEFLSEARRWDNAMIPGTIVWEYTALGGESFFAGFENRDPIKPIGGACDLNTKPWPVYRAYCKTCGEWLEGHVVLEIGHEIQFFSWMATEAERLVMALVDIGDDHWIGLFGNTPYTYVATSGDPKFSTAASSFDVAPTGVIPPPPIPPWRPGPTGAWPPPPGDPTPIPTGVQRESDIIIFSSGFDVLKPNTGETGPDMGKIVVGPAIKTASRPFSLTDSASAWVVLPGSTWLHGGDMLLDAWQLYLPLEPGWNLLYAQLYGAVPWNQSNLHCYVNKSLAGDFVNPGGSFPTPEYDFFLPPAAPHAPGQIYTVPIGYVYCAADEAGMAIITLSEENRPPHGTPDQYYVLGFLTRHLMLEYGS